MTMIKHVSASMTKNGPAFYKGQEIHPSVIDEGSDLLSQAMQDKDNLINAHGVKVIPVKKSVDGALPHFRIHDERYQEKLGVFGETIHNRFRDVTFQMLQDDGGKSLHRITAFDGMDRFQYGNCKCESEVDGYRPDVAVSTALGLMPQAASFRAIAFRLVDLPAMAANGSRPVAFVGSFARNRYLSCPVWACRACQESCSSVGTPVQTPAAKIACTARSELVNVYSLPVFINHSFQYGDACLCKCLTHYGIGHIRTACQDRF